jgi:hypothetical protein
VKATVLLEKMPMAPDLLPTFLVALFRGRLHPLSLILFDLSNPLPQILFYQFHPWSLLIYNPLSFHFPPHLFQFIPFLLNP